MSDAHRVLVLDSVGGVAGDMFAAAFVDAGIIEPRALEAVPELLGLSAVNVRFETVTRASIHATRMVVTIARAEGGAEGLLAAGSDHSHVHVRGIIERIRRSRLAPEVHELAVRVFSILAEAEAEVHGRDVESVALHEVGADDALVDVVAAAICVTSAGAGKVFATPLKLGSGYVSMGHGTYPVPPPATALIVKGLSCSLPPHAGRTWGELTTPTGAAIVKALGPTFLEGWPGGTLGCVGYGAGARDLGTLPNVFRVALFDSPEVSLESFIPEDVVELEFYVDDDTPEHIAWLQQEVLRRGALDSWLLAATGKKGRLGTVMRVLSRPDDVPATVDFLLRASTTLGLRVHRLTRHRLHTATEVRPDPSGVIRVKVAHDRTGRVLKEKEEYEDAKERWEEHDPRRGQ